MAVFVDKIVMKTTSDPEATILTNIAPGGADEITPGEIVVGLTPGTARLYTLDSNNSPVSLGGTASTSLAGLSDVDVTTNPPTPNQSLAYDAVTGMWVPSTPVVGASQLQDLTDVDLQTNGLGEGYYLRYDNVAAQYLSNPSLGPLSDHGDVYIASTPANGQSLVYNSSEARWEPGIPSLTGLTAVQDDPAPVLGGDLFLDDRAITNDDDIVLRNNDSSSPSIVFRSGAGISQTMSLQWKDSLNQTYFELSPSTVSASRQFYRLKFPATSGAIGQTLSYSSPDGSLSWVDIGLEGETDPTLNADLDTNDFFIINDSSGDHGINIHGYKLYGVDDSTDQEGMLKIWDKHRDNYVGITVNATIGQDWSLTLPSNPGLPGYVLTTDGSGNATWSVGPAADVSLTSIDELQDVDTSSSAPSLNEALIWDGTNWVPGTAAANVTNNSIGDFNDVVLSNAVEDDVLVYDAAVSKWKNEQRGIQDGRDYGLSQTEAIVFEFSPYGTGITPGEWEVLNTLSVEVNNDDANSVSFQNYMLAFSGNYPSTFSFSTTGEPDSFTTIALTTVVNSGVSWTLASDTAHNLASSGSLYVTLESPPVTVPLTDGYVLTWDQGLGKFVPLENLSGTLDYNDLINTPVVPASIDDLNDVDTSTSAPGVGQVLEWDGSNWVAGDGQSIDAVQSINGKSGRVFLGIQDMVDYSDAGAPGRTLEYNKNIGEAGAAYTQEGVWGPANAGNDLLVSPTAVGGIDLSELVEALPSTGNLWIYNSATNSWAGPATYLSITEDFLGTGAINFAGVGAYFNSAQNVDIKIAFVDPTTTATAKLDKDLLRWNAANLRFEPMTIDSISGGTFGSGL